MPTTYRRRLRRRQFVVFAFLSVFIAVVLVGATVIYTGLTPNLLAAPFSTATPKANQYGIVPCPSSAGAHYVAAASITANVLNSTTAPGLAAQVASDLKTRGVKIGTVGNAPRPFSGGVLIQTGAKGVDAAYSLLKFAPADSSIVIDTRTNATVDFIVGSNYQALAAGKTTVINTKAVITPLQSCVPLSQITPSSAPKATTKPTPTATKH